MMEGDTELDSPSISVVAGADEDMTGLPLIREG
jgi:hypothetical protein